MAPLPAPVQQQNQSTGSMPPPPPQVTSTLIDNSHQYYKYNIGTALVSTVSANSLISYNGQQTSSTNLMANIQQNSKQAAATTTIINHHSKPISQYSANFWENYEHLCALQNLMPLQSLKACLSVDGGANLNLNVDKLKSADWDPLLNTMRVNKNLKLIQFHSNYFPQNENDPNGEKQQQQQQLKGYAKLKKPPSIRNKDRTNKLCRSLKECLSLSHYLSKLELYNIPLTVKDCGQVAKGLRCNKSIKILSLDRCLIGDEGLSVICKDIQGTSNLNRVNFSSCQLTHEGASILASLIKVQALKRHNEAWKDSLRYGRPDLDSMFGIRRITINSNNLIGDKGVQYLADAFKSDLWLKALDLQDCGITTIGARYLLDGLKFNAMMHVLDVRLNVNIDRDTLQKIMEQVMINSSGNNTDYEWMDLTQTASMLNKPANTYSQTKQHLTAHNSGSSPSNPTSSAQQHTANHQLSKNLIKKRRNTNTSFSKRNQLSSSINSLSKMKRCKSTGSVVFAKSPTSSEKKRAGTPKLDQNSGGGIPWRAAARANRYRVSNNCAYRKVINSQNNLLDLDEDDDDFEQEFDEEELGSNNNNNNNKQEDNEQDLNNLLMTSLTFDNEKFVTSSFATHKKQQQQLNNIKQASSSRKSTSDFASSLNKIKNISVKDLLVILQKEQESKSQLEDMLLKFKDENTKLKAQISMLKTKVDQQQEQINQQQQQNPMNRTLLDDDKALEIIERAFYKYQNFLDFLRNAGFGKLIDIGEMNQIEKTASYENEEEEAEVNEDEEDFARKIKPLKYLKSSSKSPIRSKLVDQYDDQDDELGLSDQQKYYLNKINKTKSKLTSNQNPAKKHATSNKNNHKHTKNNKQNENNIDTLLSNALEISKSYRRFNSSIINSTGIYGASNNGKHQNGNDRDATLLNANQEIESKLLPDINDLEKSTELLINQYKNMKTKKNEKELFVVTNTNTKNQLNKKTISPLSNKSSNNLNDLIIDIDKNVDSQNIPHSTASTSPQTTVVTNHRSSGNHNQHQQPPPVSSRTSIKDNFNKNANQIQFQDLDGDFDNDDNDKEIEDDNVSEVISEDSKYYFDDDVSNLRAVNNLNNNRNRHLGSVNSIDRNLSQPNSFSNMSDSNSGTKKYVVQRKSINQSDEEDDGEKEEENDEDKNVDDDDDEVDDHF